MNQRIEARIVWISGLFSQPIQPMAIDEHVALLKQGVAAARIF
jgi:hypothetical protein